METGTLPSKNADSNNFTNPIVPSRSLEQARDRWLRSYCGYSGTIDNKYSQEVRSQHFFCVQYVILYLSLDCLLRHLVDRNHSNFESCIKAERADCLLQKRHTMSLLQQNKPACLFTVFLRMYTELHRLVYNPAL